MNSVWEDCVGKFDSDLRVGASGLDELVHQLREMNDFKISCEFCPFDGKFEFNKYIKFLDQEEGVERVVMRWSEF